MNAAVRLRCNNRHHSSSPGTMERRRENISEFELQIVYEEDDVFAFRLNFLRFVTSSKFKMQKKNEKNRKIVNLHLVTYFHPVAYFSDLSFWHDNLHGIIYEKASTEH